MKLLVLNNINMSDEIIKWPIPKVVEDSLPVQARTKFIEGIKKNDVQNILKKWIYVEPEEIRLLHGLIIEAFNLTPYNGKIAELGAGCGLNTAILANYPNVDVVYAIEYVEQVVTEIMPIIIKNYALKNAFKINKIVGNFDYLNVQDNFFDFIFEYMSFHHSDNINKTIKESYRALNRGGYLIMVDRAQKDSISDESIKKLLNIEYDNKFKNEYGYPQDIKITRFMNGEREYRVREYISALKNAGFKKITFKNLYNKRCGPLIKIMSPLLSRLPNKLQSKIFRKTLFWNGSGIHQIFVSKKI